MKGLLPAGVGCFDVSHMAGGIAAVYFVDEYYSRVSGFPGIGDDKVINIL